MRILVVFILLAFGLVTEGKTQRLNDAKTQSKDSATLRLCDSASYYESSIRKADSLYKNYLPQYNFEEVKAAMEFFDSYQQSAISGQRWRLFGKEADDENRLIAESRQLTAAKAHYYHAVGLTERDDIVGACEHYLIALEIMEDDDIIKSLRDTKTQRRKVLKKQRNDEKTLCDSVTLRLCDSDEDYEKIKFVYLIHTRLGEIFYDANFCDISIINYKKALYYSIIRANDISTARTFKCIGHTFMLSNIVDSALYYYNKSLNSSIDNINKLDVEKCIAQILFDKGEKDSAYIILRNNLKIINNENIKHSYHFTLGNMFYIDKAYDSALYYLENTLDENIITHKIAFTTKLSSIYDSLGNYEKRAYYDNISSKLLISSTNKGIDKSKLQVLYNDYNERNQKKSKAIAKKRTIYLCNLIIIVVLSVFITIRYKYKKHSNKLSEEIRVKDKHIKQNEFKNALIEGKIKSTNLKLKQKDEQIKSQQLKIYELQSKLENRKDNLKEYFQSEICVKILNEINELSKSNRMTSELKPLNQEEFAILLQTANLHLGKFIKYLSERYPSLKKEDLYYLCLVALNLNDKQISALFNVTYNAIRSRRKKICTLLGIDINENIYKNILV